MKFAVMLHQAANQIRVGLYNLESLVETLISYFGELPYHLLDL